MPGQRQHRACQVFPYGVHAQQYEALRVCPSPLRQLGMRTQELRPPVAGHRSRCRGTALQHMNACQMNQVIRIMKLA